MSKIKEDVVKFLECISISPGEDEIPLGLTDEQIIFYRDILCKELASSLPEMSEEEIHEIAYKEHSKEGLDDEVGYKRIRPPDYVEAGIKAYQDKLKKELTK